MGLNPEFLLKFYLLSIILLVSHTKKLYCGPETQPVISMIYIETPKDLTRLEQAAQFYFKLFSSFKDSLEISSYFCGFLRLYELYLILVFHIYLTRGFKKYERNKSPQ